MHLLHICIATVSIQSVATLRICTGLPYGNSLLHLTLIFPTSVKYVRFICKRLHFNNNTRMLLMKSPI